MKEPQGRYSSHLLRLWWTANSGEEVCRASLESAHSSKRTVFATLDDLLDFLLRTCGEPPWEDDHRDRERR
jgi:hypothetical protein